MGTTGRMWATNWGRRASDKAAGATAPAGGAPPATTEEQTARVWHLFLDKLVAQYPEHPWAQQSAAAPPPAPRVPPEGAPRDGGH
jgi:hypothetical protein